MADFEFRHDEHGPHDEMQVHAKTAEAVRVLATVCQLVGGAMWHGTDVLLTTRAQAVRLADVLEEAGYCVDV
jgi:hypothetical protein